MADHAWSTIKAGDKVVKPGETVTRQQLDVSKEEYDELKEAGAIRSVKHPETNASESPREANIRKFAEKRKELEDSMFEEMPDLYAEEGGSVLPTAKDAVEV
jgi:hypothetical protein